METKTITFNRNPLVFSGKIEQPSMDEIKNTLGLWCASLEDAVRYGGNLTRAALGAMNIRGDRKHIIVDTKISMLKPGWNPAIPGWHVDGTPRGEDLNPLQSAPPNLYIQEELRPSRFHLLVTGEGCLTKFVNQPLDLEVPNYTPDIFKIISNEVSNRESELNILTAPSCQVVEFDWWDIHTGITATKSEWRYLIRVTETDLCPPETDLRKVIRMQQQVYSTPNFGW
ncbi:gp274 [Bacillus phage G]|uniref:Gp274 n=1 Tax=Bacillus phage G TaxID=2884420 RepID=G3MA15_9CAUD|nr:gp274 [Bacillus phage G]AEO93533.1 gp274 [Bacillus phage G]